MCFKVVCRMFHGCFMGVSRMFQGCWKLRGCFQSASKVLKAKFQKCSKQVSSLLQGSFNGISRMFQRISLEVSR